jgi:alpha-N-arabinofuranosidase
MTRKYFIILILLFPMFLRAQSKEAFVVQVDKPITEIQPTMWGVFFEDINFAADGGLYAELVKNRSFEFATPLMGWKEENRERFALSNAGQAMIVNEGSAVSNRRFARVSVLQDKGYGLTNEGFRGMGIKKDLTYNFSILTRLREGNTKLRVVLVNEKGEPIGETAITPQGAEWKLNKASFKATQIAEKAKLQVWFDGKGIIDVDVISLFPSDTWKNRERGLRHDLVQKLADLKPGFIRFPGGCIVEGRDLSQRYQWKKTVGNAEDREILINRWNTEFNHRPAPDYFQTFGLGFFEYFQLAEDLGAEPLPILSCGLACQFNTAEVVPMDQLEPYVNDALDLIEFANGDASTKWGGLRAAMGHPKPFNMKFIGVGNEQWGEQYIERYKVFEKALKAKHPEIIIVSGTGPFPEGELFDYAMKQLTTLKAEIVDEHYYAKPEWFLKNATRYDNYDRNGPKIFAGEYAAQSVAIASPDNKNNWECALSEAAFMTGLERNADVVHLASYAPLLAHAEGWQWTPDLIWFNNLESYATPNYYVQQLFSVNKGTHGLSILSGKDKVVGQNGLYASSVWDKNTKEIIIKIVNATDQEQTQDIQLNTGKKLNGQGTVIRLKSENLQGVNSFQSPSTIAPVTESMAIKGKKVKAVLPKKSLTIIKIKTA